MLKPVAVELKNGVIIPVSEIPARTREIHTNVAYVHFDGFRSFGKSWAQWNGTEWTCTRIGYGANGDGYVWHSN